MGNNDEPPAKSCALADAGFGPNGAWELFARSTGTVERFSRLLGGEPPSAAGDCAAKPSLGKTVEGAFTPRSKRACDMPSREIFSAASAPIRPSKFAAAIAKAYER